jgi:hypothetical protein
MWYWMAMMLKVCPRLRFVYDFRYDGAGRGIGVLLRKKIIISNGMEQDGRPMGGFCG